MSTAALMASSAQMAASCFGYGLTPGNLGGTAGVFGYSTIDSNPGSLSPIGTLRGVTIQRLRSATADADLRVSLVTAGLPQTFWRMVLVQGTDGDWRRYMSASATSFSNAGITTWAFGTGSSPVWTATTPAPRGVLFFV